MLEPTGGGVLRKTDLRRTATGPLVSPAFRYLAANKDSIEASGPEEIQALVQQFDVVISDVHPRDEVTVFGATLDALRLRQLPPAARSLVRIIFETMREPMFLLLVGAAGLYLTLGDLAEGLFLMGGALATIANHVRIKGHTADTPFHTGRFESN